MEKCCETCDIINDRTKEHILRHIKQRIPTTFTEADIDLLPRRQDFIEPKVLDYVKKSLNKPTQTGTGSPILFMPNDVKEHTDKDDTYSVYVYGVFVDGSKVCVRVTNIPIYIDLMYNANTKMDNNESRHLNKEALQIKLGLKFNHYEEKLLHPSKGFQVDPSNVMRVSFTSHKAREACIKLINENNAKYDEEIATNPTSPKRRRIMSGHDENGKMMNNAYWNMICREFRFNAGDWNIISDYEQIDPTQYNCDYVLSVKLSGYTKLKKAARAKMTNLAKYLNKDNMIVMAWDIETYSHALTGAIPHPRTVREWDLFCIGGAFMFHHSYDIIFDYTIINVDSSPRKENPFVFVVKDEKAVCSTFYKIYKRFMPDFITAFNGSNFDWPCYLAKIQQYKLLDEMRNHMAALPGHKYYLSGDIFKKKPSGKYAMDMYKLGHEETIKINAEQNFVADIVMMLPGAIDLDIRPLFMQEYPKAEVGNKESLNFYLKTMKLEGKIDMDYMLMFKIYELCSALVRASDDYVVSSIREFIAMVQKKHPLMFIEEIKSYHAGIQADALGFSTLELSDFAGRAREFARACAGEVAYYCKIDAYRTHELMLKRLMYIDKREMANLSHVTMWQCFYRANGGKISNIIGKYMHKLNYCFNNLKVDRVPEDKFCYGGGFVFNPKTGLFNKRPITALDFASLYPNLFRAYNICMTTVVKTVEERDRLVALGYTLILLPVVAYKMHEPDCTCHPVAYTTQGWVVASMGNLGKNTHAVTAYEKTVTYKVPTARGEVTASYKHALPSAKKIVSTTQEPEVGVVVDACEAFKYDLLDSVGYETMPDDVRALLADAIGPIKREMTRTPIYGRTLLKNERMGILGIIMDKILGKRIPLKKLNMRMNIALEAAEKYHAETIDFEGKQYTIADFKFEIAKINKKQMALKILLNSFYGQTGNYRNTGIYDVLVAGGITALGQLSIKFINSVLKYKKHEPIYGDTDSQYFMIRGDLFRTLDNQYARAVELSGLSAFAPENSALRKEYWTALVELTFAEVKKANEEMDDALIMATAGLFLNVAFEEVNFPTVFCGKKKYFYLEHIAEINFDNGKIVPKGIDIVKQGKSVLIKQLGNEFMERALSINNNQSLIEIAESILNKFFGTKWDINYFVQTAKYKPDKNNVRINNFVARMTERYDALRAENDSLAELYTPPEPITPFKYVNVEKATLYTTRGTKVKDSASDHMEYLDVYNHYKDTMRINLKNYAEELFGLLARFINDGFAPALSECDPDKDYDRYDAVCVNNALMYIQSFCKDYIAPKELRSIGLMNRAIYSRIEKMRSRFSSTYIEDLMRQLDSEVRAHSCDYLNEWFKRNPAISPEYLSRTRNLLEFTREDVRRQMIGRMREMEAGLSDERVAQLVESARGRAKTENLATENGYDKEKLGTILIEIGVDPELSGFSAIMRELEARIYACMRLIKEYDAIAVWHKYGIVVAPPAPTAHDFIERDRVVNTLSDNELSPIF